MICGGTISGNCASGSPRIAMRPARTVTIAITIATIGRRIKKFEIICPREGGVRERGSEGAGEWGTGERGSGGRNISLHLLISLSPALPLSRSPTPHSRSFIRDRIDHRVGSDFLYAFGDDSFTRLQSVFNNPHRANAFADLDWPNAHFVITAHDGDSVAALQFGDGSLRNK